MLRNEDELQGKIHSFLRRKARQYPELEDTPDRLRHAHTVPKAPPHRLDPLWHGPAAS